MNQAIAPSLHPKVLELKAWVEARGEHPGNIPEDFDLIGNSVLDSFGFVEFIVLIQQKSEQPIDMDSLDLKAFRSFRAIQENFFTRP